MDQQHRMNPYEGKKNLDWRTIPKFILAGCSIFGFCLILEVSNTMSHSAVFQKESEDTEFV